LSPAMDIVWERPEPPERPVPAPLSRERIVNAALVLADADGLAAVSLRKVAAVLDAGPMRLYGYIATKEELLDLMVDAVHAEIPPATGDWRGALRSLAHGLRDATRRHPWFADLLGGRPSLGPHALAHGEATLAALDAAPEFADIDAVVRVHNTVMAYTIGAIRREVADQRAETASGMDKRQWQHTMGPYLTRVLDTGRYPTITKMVRDATHLPPDVVFDAGLAQVLDGVAARLADIPDRS
jgi:AcrR family transcriptional regulator